MEVFTEDRFFELLYGGENFMINFHTDWCGACPEHLEKLRNAAPSVEGRLVVGEIDITANWERPDDPIMELLGIPMIASETDVHTHRLETMFEYNNVFTPLAITGKWGVVTPKKGED